MARYAKFFSLGAGGGGTNNLQLPVGTILDATLRQVQDGLGTGSPLYLSTRRVGITSDSSVTTQTSSVIQATTTNANLVIAPNGTGALIASIPDGTVTGGNARGANAVDLQTTRGAATNVASGNYSVISGGQGNTASSTHSAVLSGQTNTASTGTHSAVIGGRNNTSSGTYSIVGGNGCQATGSNSFAHGDDARASGSASVAVGGTSIRAIGAGSVALGGLAANATSSYSLAQGYFTQTKLLGQTAFSGGSFTTASALCQQSNIVALREATLTTASTTVLSLDGTGVTNLVIPPDSNRMWNVQVRWVAVVTSITGTATGVTVGDTKVSTDLLAVAKRSNITTVGAHTSAGTSVIETTAGSLTAANIVYSAGASQEMAITFTGPTFVGGGSVTMRVVAAISLTEVSY
jgi:hypothetical protein